MPHVEALSRAAGQQIIPSGGDFIVQEWDSWWSYDPKLHYNDLAFLPAAAEENAVGFIRCELYGSPCLLYTSPSPRDS